MSKTNFLKKKECNYDHENFGRIIMPGGLVVMYDKKEEEAQRRFEREVTKNVMYSKPTESYRMTFLDFTKPTEK